MNSKRLTDTEWILLQALWNKPPQTLKEVIASVQAEAPHVKWSYKTYHTYLRNMQDKDLVICEIKNSRDNFYSANISREQALRIESNSLLGRISRGSVGELVAMMAESGQLTEPDRRELMDLADRLEEESKEKK